VANLYVEKRMRPPIICICGSSRFCDLIAVEAWNQEKMGNIVLGMHLLPDWYWQATGKVGIGHAAEQEGCAAVLDELHLRKIDMADSIIVVNQGGYIGERTKYEIEYATKRGKSITYTWMPKPAA
jgi:predicted TIM-barrel enzyme